MQSNAAAFIQCCCILAAVVISKGGHQRALAIAAMPEHGRVWIAFGRSQPQCVCICLRSGSVPAYSTGLFAGSARHLQAGEVWEPHGDGLNVAVVLLDACGLAALDNMTEQL